MGTAKGTAEDKLPAELRTLRCRIDEVDNDLMALLARRFQLTRRVGELKAVRSMQALDASRERWKLAALREQCEQLGLNPELITELFSRIMREAVSNHEDLIARHRQSAGHSPRPARLAPAAAGRRRARD